MTEVAGCHILAVMGSGETSPTMVTMHRALVARLELERPRAVVLETPYRFQVNAAALSARTRNDYFARSVGLDVTVLPGLRPPDGAADADAAVVRDADWVFSGPGSPTRSATLWPRPAFSSVTASTEPTGTWSRDPVVPRPHQPDHQSGRRPPGQTAASVAR
ncbi:MAG: hypothetical protein ACRDNF_08575 [Streptosporangiaceae bacterium]